MSRGDGTVVPPVALPISQLVRSIATADIDGDGDMDFAMVADDTLGDPVVRIIRNDTPPMTTDQVVLSLQEAVLGAGTGPVIVLGGDVDNDGEDDLVTINNNTLPLGRFVSAGGDRASGRGQRGRGVTDGAVGVLLNVPEPLPATGACCRADGSCDESQQQVLCETTGGVYKGDMSLCVNADCPQPCHADIVPFGGDGQVTIADINSVLTAYGLPCVNCPQDIVPQPDGDNAVTIADINAVLTAYGPCQ